MTHYASLSEIPNVIHCEHYRAKRQEDRFALASCIHLAGSAQGIIAIPTWTGSV